MRVERSFNCLDKVSRLVVEVGGGMDWEGGSTGGG